MTTIILIVTITNMIMGAVAVWQRHQTVKSILAKRRKKDARRAAKAARETGKL